MLFKGVIPIAILALVLGVIALIAKIVSVTTLPSAILFVSVAAFIGAFFMLVYLIVSFFKIRKEIVDSRRTQFEEEKPSLLWRALVATVDGLISACSFIKETVQMTYKAECPMIIWGEETGPIEKRNK